MDGSLAELVRENPLRPRRAADYVRQAAEAIHYAHRQGTLHRDLKPSNLLIDRSDQVRITDFGLAMRVEGSSELTRTGQVLGSPSYMPPEQAQGKRSLIGPASDVYAPGAILYELLTGRHDGPRLWSFAGDGHHVPFQHNIAIGGASLSPDGLFVITGGEDKVARVWEADTGQPVTGPFVYPARVGTVIANNVVAVSPDGRKAAVALENGAVHSLVHWKVPLPAAGCSARSISSTGCRN